jgi:hypothetical protein
VGVGRVYIPAKLLRRGCLLLNQQCWLWGQDVRRAEGNLLLAHGFERLRAKNGSSASSQYTLSLGTGRCVRLWGFGLFYGDAVQGIYLNRFEFLPRVVALDGDRWYESSELQELDPAGDTVLLREVLGWIAGYERWVLAQYGVGYREACARGWKKRPVLPEALPVAWEELATALWALPLQERLLRAG